MLFSLIVCAAFILVPIGFIVLYFYPEKSLSMSNQLNNTKPSGFWKRHGCIFLRGRSGQKFARHVFFGRDSFPDVELKNIAKNNSLDTSWLKSGS